MDLPFYLKVLPTEALEVLRYYQRLGNTLAFSDAIIQSAGLSDRGFGKAIRRLVTKGYLVLDGDQRYRLTELGQRAVSDLPPVDEWEPEGLDDESAGPRVVERELVLVAPGALVANKPASVDVGFAPAMDEARGVGQFDVLLRLSVMNGQPAIAQETAMILDSRPSRHAFEITAGRFRQARLRLEAFQMGDTPDETHPCGGMYIDVDVLPPGAAAKVSLAAYRTTARFVLTG